MDLRGQAGQVLGQVGGAGQPSTTVGYTEGITDTACAASRPLKNDVYGALRQLGAPASMPEIGYRCAFSLIGYKGLVMVERPPEREGFVKSEIMVGNCLTTYHHESTIPIRIL